MFAICMLMSLLGWLGIYTSPSILGLHCLMKFRSFGGDTLEFFCGPKLCQLVWCEISKSKDCFVPARLELYMIISFLYISWRGLSPSNSFQQTTKKPSRWELVLPWDVGTSKVPHRQEYQPLKDRTGSYSSLGWSWFWNGGTVFVLEN